MNMNEYVNSMPQSEAEERKNQLKQYLVDEAEYTKEAVDAMSPRDLIDAFLQWEGIIGYTSHIIHQIEAAYGITLSQN